MATRTFTDEVVDDQTWNYLVNGVLYWHIGGIRVSDADLTSELAALGRDGSSRSKASIRAWYESQDTE